ncbi:MAG: hypothetical protein ACF8TS_22075, partial [Maioricimonas sp. JB049]
MSPRKKKSKASSGSGKSDDSQERLHKARELVKQAYDSTNEREQRKLARQATRLTPDYSAAWALLGDLAASDKTALSYYRKAVAAVDREVGEPLCNDLEAGRASIDDAHPWFMWRHDLALCLFELDQVPEAIDLAKLLLRHAPLDDQGVRYLLAAALLHEQRHDELGQLLDQYRDDDTAVWMYSRALLSYRLEGATETSDQLLHKAFVLSPYVPDYLIGLKELPDEIPDSPE